MAAFLDLQFLGLKERSDRLTVFALIDEAMVRYVGNVKEYSNTLRRHLVLYLYVSDWLVVHGIRDILLDIVRSKEASVQDAESTTFEIDHHHHHCHSDHRRHDHAHNPAEHSHFSVFH